MALELHFWEEPSVLLLHVGAHARAHGDAPTHGDAHTRTYTRTHARTHACIHAHTQARAHTLTHRYTSARAHSRTFVMTRFHALFFRSPVRMTLNISASEMLGTFGMGTVHLPAFSFRFCLMVLLNT
jgi:hypothetical protein